MIFMVPTNWFDNVSGLSGAFSHLNRNTLEINMMNCVMGIYSYVEQEEPVNSDARAPGTVNEVPTIFTCFGNQ